MAFPEAETRKATVIERKVAAPPKSTAIEGPLPRPLLMVKLVERNEPFDDNAISTIWVCDPAAPEKELERVFIGPGQSQYLHSMTPLSGGWGVAYGQLDPEKEPDKGSQRFWFNLLSGETGPTVDVDLWGDQEANGWIVGQQRIEAEDGSKSDRISRYHPLKAVVQTTQLDFSYINWLEPTDVLGVAKLDVGERIVRLDVETSQYKIIAEPPPGYDRNDNGGWNGWSIGLAGTDGLYAVNGFALWFRPFDGAWHHVIRDVHIVKTFGGAPPFLPVRYVGDGRFAVAKTIQDEIEVPADTPPDEVVFRAAVAVTMLIDGITGKVVKESAPNIYNHNPSPVIPDDWWSGDLKPKPPVQKPKQKSLFQWNEEKRELSFADGKVLKLSEDDKFEESEEGRYLAIYQAWADDDAKGRTKVTFRIIDGETGQVQITGMTSEFREVMVDVSWQVLSSQSPDPQMQKDHQDAGTSPD
jgi:hypothetical protein